MPKHSSSAKVVDGSLVLSLPDAITPVVMRLSLEEAKSAAFTVLEKKDKHVLTVQFSEKESREIAPYDSKEQAVAALMAASAALEKGAPVFSSGKVVVANENSRMSLKGMGKWVVAFGVLFALVWFITSMNGGLPRAPLPASLKQGAENTAQTMPNKNPFTDAKKVTGKPVSADEFLSRGQ